MQCLALSAIQPKRVGSHLFVLIDLVKSSHTSIVAWEYGLKNKKHRRQVCKERGLTPVGGDLNEDEVFSKFDERRDREEKEYNDYVDRLDNAPEFLEYRKAVDKGQVTL